MEKRRFSRWMPPLHDSERSRATGALGWTLIAVIGVAPVILAVKVFIAMPVIAGGLLLLLVVLSWKATRQYEAHMIALLADRDGEDIGTFAWMLDRRAPHFDSWIVRAVWDELATHTGVRDLSVPLRPADRFEEDLLIDPEEIEWIAKEVAGRAGRDAANWERNPVRIVKTVDDLIRLVAYQPRVVG